MTPARIDVEHAPVLLNTAFKRLMQYLSNAPLATYDIYDFMGVPWIGRLFIKRRQGDRLSGPLIKAVQGAVLLAPVLSRRLLGIKPTEMSGALAFYAHALCDASIHDQDQQHVAQARDLLARVAEMRLGEAELPAWGFPFAWPRDVLVPANTPITYSTAVVGQAYLRLWELTKDAQAREQVLACRRSIMQRFNETNYDDGSRALGYTVLDSTSVINVSAIAGCFLLQTRAVDKDVEVDDYAASLLRFVLNHQAPDGSWPYSTKDAFVDGSHTGMVLQALANAAACTADMPLRERCISALKKGLSYYLDKLFTSDGLPMMYSTAAYPLDIGTVAEAISAFDALWPLRDLLGEARIGRMAWLWRTTAVYAVQLLQDRDGSFAARYYPPLKMNMHSLRWGASQALRALALTLRWLAAGNVDGPPPA
jgi:hypothetical protein